MHHRALIYLSVVFSAAGAHAAHLPTILKPREAIIGDGSIKPATAAHHQDTSRNVARPLIEHEKRYPLSNNRRCGKGFGTKCPGELCCSGEGWCGAGYKHCSAPACQHEYGPGCDANKRPNGRDTEFWPRPKVGDVRYGDGIYHCQKEGVIAITFDDGPYTYTADLLNLLRDYGVKATFFVTGRNLGKGAINNENTDWPALIRRMANEGHQIASHTWSHQRLTTLSELRVRRQMLWNEIAIADILGYFPTYMRPPYSASNGDVDSWLRDLGYHITYFNLDTEGYLHNARSEVRRSKDIFDHTFLGKQPKNSQFLHIEHDTMFQTVYNLTEYMIKEIRNTGFKTVTVGECLNDPEENWYRWPDKNANKEERKQEGNKEEETPKVSGREVKDASPNPPKPEPPTRPHPAKPPPPVSPNPMVPVQHAPDTPPTKDGRCGPFFGHASCAWEKTAPCCSEHGWCGKTNEHCHKGCQGSYGKCARML